MDMELARRLAPIEAQLLLLSKHVGVPCPPFASTMLQGAPQSPTDPMAEVQALARSGRAIDAIKLFRQLTGAGLAEAKQAVDSM